jgi:hypothetical protein
VLRDLHRVELPVPGTEPRLRSIVFGPVGQDFGMSTEHDPPEQGPIFVVAIDDDSKKGDATLYGKKGTLPFTSRSHVVKSTGIFKAKGAGHIFSIVYTTDISRPAPVLLCCVCSILAGVSQLQRGWLLKW